jgi:hypothetical protein
MTPFGSFSILGSKSQFPDLLNNISAFSNRNFSDISVKLFGILTDRKSIRGNMKKSKFDIVPEKEEKVSRSFYIDLADWEEFKRQCEKAGRSASEVLAALVKDFIQK